jgi:hypothetical protein
MTPGSFSALKATLFALLDDERRIGGQADRELRHVAGRLGLSAYFSHPVRATISASARSSATRSRPPQRLVGSRALAGYDPIAMARAAAE